MSDSNTKSRIFDTALRLFAEQGYENVSVRDIANEVGIKVGSIYNHYSSKEQILEACYDFFVAHRHDNRMSSEQYEPILRNGTKEEVVAVLLYVFPNAVLINMFFSLSIISSRMHNERRAREIFSNEITSALTYLAEFFNRGIAVGRFHEFNVLVISLMIFSTRLLIAHLGIVPTDMVDTRRAELEVSHELLNIIPFAY